MGYFQGPAGVARPLNTREASERCREEQKRTKAVCGVAKGLTAAVYLG